MCWVKEVVYPNAVKTYVYTKNWTFIDALFIIYKLEKIHLYVIPKRQYYRDRKLIKGCQGLGAGEGLTTMRWCFFRRWNDYMRFDSCNSYSLTTCVYSLTMCMYSLTRCNSYSLTMCVYSLTRCALNSYSLRAYTKQDEFYYMQIIP